MLCSRVVSLYASRNSVRVIPFRYFTCSLLASVVAFDACDMSFLHGSQTLDSHTKPLCEYNLRHKPSTDHPTPL